MLGTCGSASRTGCPPGRGRTLPVIFPVSSQIGPPTPVGRVRPLLNVVSAASCEEAAHPGGSLTDEIVREGARTAGAVVSEVGEFSRGSASTPPPTTPAVAGSSAKSITDMAPEDWGTTVD